MSKEGFNVGDPVQIYGGDVVGIIVGERKRGLDSKTGDNFPVHDVLIGGEVKRVAVFALNRLGEQWCKF